MSGQKIAMLGPSRPYKGGIVHFNDRLVIELQQSSDNTVHLYGWKRLYPAFLTGKKDSDFHDKNLTGNILGKSCDQILDYYNPLTWWKLFRRIAKARDDVFITHWVHPVHFPVFLFLFTLLRISTRTQIVLICHNVEPHESMPGSRLLSRWIFLFCHRVVVHSVSEQGNASKLTSQFKIRTAFIPLYDFFPKRTYDSGALRSTLSLQKKVVLFFGLIRPYKGLEHLIEAFVEVKEQIRDISLLIVGESFVATSVSNTYEPLSRIQELGLGDTVAVVNRYVADEDIFQYFDIADMLVAPYTSASQSAPVQLAYAFDTPVIATRVGGLAEVVEEGVSGYLAEPGDCGDLARQIVRFYREGKVTATSVHTYKSRFSWGRYVDLIMDQRIASGTI